METYKLGEELDSFNYQEVQDGIDKDQYEERKDKCA